MIFLYPQKTIKNHMFSDVFMEYRKKPVAWNALTMSMPNKQNHV